MSRTRQRWKTWCEQERKLAFRRPDDARKVVQTQRNDPERDDPLAGHLGIYRCRKTAPGEPKHWHVAHDIPRRERNRISRSDDDTIGAAEGILNGGGLSSSQTREDTHDDEADRRVRLED